MPYSRKLTLAVAALALVAGSSLSLAQLSLVPGDEEPTDSIQARPELVFDADSIELGSIPDDAKITRTMKFKNAGSGMLNITGTRGSCGCTVPGLTKTSYAPGEQGEITVTFDPHHKNGAVRNTVWVTSNDTVHPQREFYIVGTVNPIVTIEPQMVNFGQVRKGTKRTQEVTITARLPQFDVTQAIAGDPKVVDAKILGPVEKVGDNLWRSKIEFTVLDSAPVGTLSQTATVRTNDDARVITIGTFGQVMGDLTTQPMSVSFGMVKTGTQVSQNVKITNATGASFKILSATYQSVNAGAATTPLTVTPVDDGEGKGYTIQISGAAPETPVPIQGEIQITTDVKGEETIKIPVFGSVVDQLPGNAPMIGRQNPDGRPLPPNLPSSVRKVPLPAGPAQATPAPAKPGT